MVKYEGIADDTPAVSRDRMIPEMGSQGGIEWAGQKFGGTPLAVIQGNARQYDLKGPLPIVEADPLYRRSPE